MARRGQHWIRHARRGAVLAVLLISAHVVARAEPPPSPDNPAVPPAASDKAAPEITQHDDAKAGAIPAEPPALKLAAPKIAGKIEGTLLASSAELLEEGAEVVVEAKLSSTPSVETPPCGIASIAELLGHPTSVWRQVAPLLPTYDAAACLKATTIGEDTPEALGTMHWYE